MGLDLDQAAATKVSGSRDLAGWKRKRGLLGPLAPLLGQWRTSATHSDGSKIECARTFEMMGAGYVKLSVDWHLGARGHFLETCLFGKGDDGALSFWSFTSDGKRSTGTLADGRDVHADAVAFTAEMPAGMARFVYWPDEDGFRFAVENKTKKGWNRFVEHIYRSAS